MQHHPQHPMHPKLQLAKTLANLMDSAFTIPGTRHRVGIDPLLGLVPVAGDLIGFAISLYIIVLARQMGMSKVQITMMFMNVLLDSTIGAVPVLGDMMDLFWRANTKNIGMMERFLHKQGYRDAFSKARHDIPASEQTIDVVVESHRANRS